MLEKKYQDNNLLFTKRHSGESSLGYSLRLAQLGITAAYRDKVDGYLRRVDRHAKTTPYIQQAIDKGDWRAGLSANWQIIRNVAVWREQFGPLKSVARKSSGTPRRVLENMAGAAKFVRETVKIGVIFAGGVAAVHSFNNPGYDPDVIGGHGDSGNFHNGEDGKDDCGMDDRDYEANDE